MPTPQERHSSASYQQNHDPYIRTPNMELPIFFGDNAQAWIDECESVFALTGIPHETKVKWAHAHIRDKAKTWLSSSKIDVYLLNWTQFCDLLCDRFPAAGEHESMEQFQHLKQHGSVNQYIDQFEEHMVQMQRDHPYLTDNFFLLRFIAGLKDTVKHLVKSHNPSTLRSAYWHARQQEQAYLSATKRTPLPQQTRAAGQFLPKQQPSQKDFRPRLPSDKPKERGKCWYCPEPWTFGHKCNNVTSMLHAIQMQGHSDSDDTSDSQEIFQDASLTLPSSGPSEEQLLPQQNLETVDPADTLMLISAEALHGIPGDTTLSVLVKFGGYQAVALIDSGSTTTFLDNDFVKKAQLQTTATAAHKVLVAGGGELISRGNCSTMQIQDTRHTLSTRLQDSTPQGL
jgi:hypothetical protein